jgi:peptidyl-tRNA hydrolase
VDHVLETFRSAELPIVEETLETASWALEDWALGQSIEDVQSRYNRRTPQANSE